MSRILSIETSCDETAVSIIGGRKNSVRVLADALISQIEIHKPYGGVFPALAKREHGKNLVPLLDQALKNSKLKIQISKQKFEEERFIRKILEREPELLQAFLDFIPKIKKPKIDAIAVTHGPGLEPALWVGINFARALGMVWGKPVIPINHMEGHILAALLQQPLLQLLPLTGEEGTKRESSSPPAKGERAKGQRGLKIKNPKFPVLALLISGGHTELVLLRDWFSYKIVGETRDDAVGECYDKAARVLGLPYPGGPEISKLAEEWRSSRNVSGNYVPERVTSLSGHRSALAESEGESPRSSRWDGRGKLRNIIPTHVPEYQLPRPMLHSPDLDFSFAGLKTAVLYMVKKIPNMTDNIRREICYEFEEAAAEVLISKTLRALEKYGAKTLVIGGGVSVNTHIQRSFKEAVQKFPGVKLFLPEPNLSTDNALMIALAAHLRLIHGMAKTPKTLRAQGNLRLGKAT